MSKMIQKFRFQFLGFPGSDWLRSDSQNSAAGINARERPFSKRTSPKRFPTSPDWVRFPGFPVGSPAPSNKLGPPPILEVRPDSDFHGFP